MKTETGTAPRDVFVFRIGHFGDTLVSLPAVHRIAELHPGARLWLITNAPSESTVSAWDVLRHTKKFAGVLFYQGRSPGRLARIALRCRQAPGARLYYLTPMRSKMQFRRDQLFFRLFCGFRDISATERTIPSGTRGADGELVVLPRECDRLLHTVDKAGHSPPPPYLSPPAAARDRAEHLLRALHGRPLIALGPGSKMPAKKWFLDRYLEVCRRLKLADRDLGVVVFGGPEDRADGEALVDAVGRDRAINLAGSTDVIESAAAMTHCSLYLGNDTGTMHLAAIMGLPCIAVFTSRDNRDTWVPWGDSHVILRRDLACSGCMLVRCERERMRCLDLISVDDVWAALEPRLGGLSGRGSKLRVLP